MAQQQLGANGGMLPDPPPMINSHSSQILLILALTASATLWYELVNRLLREEPVVPPRSVPPVSWPTWIPCVALPLGIVLVLLLQYGLTRQGANLLQGVQASCIARLGVLGLLLGLPRLAGHWLRSDLGVDPQPWWTEVRLGLATALVVFPLVFGLNLFMRAEGWYGRNAVHPMLALLRDHPSLETGFWVVLAAAVLAPLFEELLYRVFLQGTWSAHSPPWLTIPVTALLFCAVHMRRGQPDGIPLLPLALGLGLLYHQRRSYLGVVTAHALFNGISITLALLDVI